MSDSEDFRVSFLSWKPGPWRWEGLNLRHSDDTPEADEMPLVAATCIDPCLMYLIKHLPSMVETLQRSPEGRQVLDVVRKDMQEHFSEMLAQMREATGEDEPAVDDDELVSTPRPGSKPS